MLDTSLVFLDDEQAPYDFISAASVQVPLALRAALGHVAVTHISGDVESHRITFKTRLQDFQGCVIQEEQLKQLGLFHELVFSNAASRLQIGSNVLLSIETVAVQNEGIPTVNTLVVVEGDQFASDSIVNLVGKHGGGLSLRSSLSGEERQIILPARRFMQEHGHLHATSSSAESSAFYGFRGPMPSTSDEASELSSLVKGSSSSSSEQFYGASYHSAKASKQVPLHNSTHNASDPAGYWAHNETTTAGVKEYATSNRVHSKAESRNVTVEFVAVFGDKRMSDLRENARMDEFMGGYLRSVTLALQVCSHLSCRPRSG